MTEPKPLSPLERKRRAARRVWIVVLLVAALAAAVVIVGGYGTISGLLANGDAGLSRRAVALVNGLLGSETTRFECDRVTGTIFQGAVLEHPRLIVRAPGREVTWAEAKRLRIEYDLWRLLVSNRRAFTADFDSLTVLLARDTTGALVMPRFRHGRGKGSPVNLDVALALRGASVLLEREGARLSHLKGRGRVSVAPGGTSVTIDRMTGLAQGPTKSTPVRLTGLLAMKGAAWRLDPFELSLVTSRVRASADWDQEHGRVRDGTLRLDPLDLGETLPLFGVEGIPGSLHGDVEFAGLPTEGAGSGCLVGTIAGEPIDTLLVRAQFDRRGVRIDQLRTLLRGAVVTGSARVGVAGELDASLRFVNADPAHLPWWKAPAGMPSGSLAGEAQLRISRARPRPSISVDGVITRSHVGRLPIDRARFLVHAPPIGGIVLDSLALDTPGARLTGSGAIDARRGLNASSTVAIAELGRMRQLLEPLVPVEGRGRATLTLGGTLEKPTVSGRAALAVPRFESGLRSDSVIVVAAGPLAPTLDLRGSLHVQGLATGGLALGDVRATFSGGRPLRVERFTETRGDTTLEMRGTVSFEGGGMRAQVDSLRLTAGDLHATATRTTEVTYQGGRLRAAPLTLDLQPGRMDADLDWDVTHARISMRGLIEELDLARMSRRRNPPVRGTLHTQFVVSGPTADPDVSLRGTIVAPRLGGVAGDSLTASLDYAPGVLNVQSVTWRQGPGRATLQGTLRPRATLEAWLKAMGRDDRSWAEGTAVALEADADSLDLATIAPVDTTLKTLRGALRLHARLGGTVAAPTAAITARASGAHYRVFDGSITSAELNFRDRVLDIAKLEVRQGDAETHVSGFVPLDLAPFAKERWRRDEPIHLSIKMKDADASIAPALTALVAASAGKVSGEAEVSGTPRKPKLTGSVQLRDGRLRFAGRYEVVEGLEVDGTFNEGELQVTRLEGRQGKRGKISGTGVWRWSGASPLPAGSVGPPGEYELKLKATDCVATDREYYLFQFSGSFVVQNGRTARGIVKPRVTGNATVTRGDLTMNLAAPVGDRPPPLPFLYYVTADFPRQLTYRQLDTEVDLAGSLQLRNEGDRDIALGVLTVKGGQFYFLTRKFQDLTGEVNFNSLERFDPDVAIDANTRVRRGEQEAIINLAVTGRASQLQIRPWDDAGTPTADLWRELSVGQFSSTQALNGAPAGDPLAGVGLGNLPIRDYLFRNAERWIAGSGFIDTIDLRSGARAGASSSTRNVGGPIDLGTIGVGKYVTRDLFLKYSRDFSDQSEDRISAEYRMTRHLLLQGQQIRRNGNVTPTSPEQEYNLDLKIRVEY